jgi:hypothetical protein
MMASLEFISDIKAVNGVVQITIPRLTRYVRVRSDCKTPHLTAPQARELAQQLVIAAEHIEAAQKEGQE